MSARVYGAAFAAIAAALAFAVAAMLHGGIAEHGSFKAFYCAGRAVLQREDPYRVEPLRSCEQSVAPGELPVQAVEPAPLPAYGLAAFLPIAALPFGTAAAVLAFASLALVLGAALLLQRLTNVPAALHAAIFAPLLLLNVAFGEIAAIAMAALVAAGYALRAERYWLAAAAVAAAALQPQAGAAAAIAMFVLVPRARLALAAAFAVLAAIGLAALGPATNLEYVQRVLPLQAVSEIAAADQYSLAHLLFLAGVPQALALRAGEISTVVMLALGIAAAPSAIRRMHAPELAVYLPVAAAILGGIYLHDIQIILALPAAIVVAVRTDANVRVVAGVALGALALVWTEFPGRAVLALDAVALTAVFVAALGLVPAQRAYVAVPLAAVFFACVLLVHAGPRPANVSLFSGHEPAHRIASIAWSDYLRATPARVSADPRLTAQKIPAWFGIVLLIACASCATRKAII